HRIGTSSCTKALLVDDAAGGQRQPQARSLARGWQHQDLSWAFPSCPAKFLLSGTAAAVQQTCRKCWPGLEIFVQM
uniref:Uncharacterized protein n=1 Tax=Cairina moschata TaxID=8855 RepID=A0A8C3CI19_CAIMO